MIRSIGVAAVLLVAFAAGALPASAGDPDGRPAAATSLDPDQMSATATSPGSRAPLGVAPGSIEASSRSPDSLVAPARSPGSLSEQAAGTAGSADASAASSPDVSRLPVDGGGADLPDRAPALVPEPAAPGRHADPSVVQAWQEVEKAERKLDAAQGAYTRMRIRNYPRGAARVRIERARIEAIQAVNHARSRYARLAASSP